MRHGRWVYSSIVRTPAPLGSSSRLAGLRGERLVAEFAVDVIASAGHIDWTEEDVVHRPITDHHPAHRGVSTQVVAIEVVEAVVGGCHHRQWSKWDVVPTATLGAIAVEVARVQHAPIMVAVGAVLAGPPRNYSVLAWTIVVVPFVVARSAGQILWAIFSGQNPAGN